LGNVEQMQEVQRLLEEVQREFFSLGPPMNFVPVVKLFDPTYSRLKKLHLVLSNRVTMTLLSLGWPQHHFYFKHLNQFQRYV
jgi:hypothetical protein